MLSLYNLFNFKDNHLLLNETYIDVLFDKFGDITDQDLTDQRLITILKTIEAFGVAVDIDEDDYSELSAQYSTKDRKIYIYIPIDGSKSTSYDFQNGLFHEFAHYLQDRTFSGRWAPEINNNKAGYTPKSEITIDEEDPRKLSQFILYFCQPHERSAVAFSFAYALFCKFKIQYRINISVLIRGFLYAYLKYRKDKNTKLYLETFTGFHKNDPVLMNLAMLCVALGKLYIIDIQRFNNLTAQMKQLFQLTEKYYKRLKGLNISNDAADRMARFGEIMSTNKTTSDTKSETDEIVERILSRILPRTNNKSRFRN